MALLQMGGPEGPEDLAPFLRALFQDPDMIRLPWWLRPLQRPLGSAFGTLRARSMREPYEAIGYSSLNDVTERLADRVRDELGEAVAGVEVAMRYTPPRARQAVQRLAEAGAEEVLALTLYPFYSDATTGSSLHDLQRAADEVGLEVRSIDRWGSSESFLDLTARWTERLWGKLAPAQREEAAVLLTTHGLPQSYVDQGDPYVDEVEAAARSLHQRLPDVERVQVCYQSDLGPVEWTRPYTPEAIEALAEEGFRHLVVVPFGFVSEHIETLYEIDQLYRDDAEACGFETFLRVPAFDDHPDFARVLTDLLRPRLEAR